MIDCGICGGKESARKLNLPIVKGLVEVKKKSSVLRDTGCEGVMVRRGLVVDDQLTGKCCLIIRIVNTVLLVKKARIQDTLSVWRRGSVMHKYVMSLAHVTTTL
ncbi:hypothetical protein RRG08_057587 [Elysia crispata]|uniref:Uncharacterized protein n=1 Tax=Elysia crispata TaxID=231223 RepID=A0AAE0ZC92_9GAST|nr:hypothetical protein RRG08_057587 [Elysia crispata]